MVFAATNSNRRTGKTTAQKRATLADVARAAGVSRWVAGHVLNKGNGNSRVSLQTSRRIQDVARKLQYHANHAAMLLRGKRSHTFGLLVASAGDPLRSFLTQYLDAEALKRGCHTLIGNTVANAAVAAEQFDAVVEEFSRRGVDGMFCAVHHWFGGNRAALLAKHPHTVFYEDPGLPGATFVAVDRQEAVRLAVRHLAERGRRRIGLAVMSGARPTHQARCRGYEAELAAQGLPLDEALVFRGDGHRPAFAWCNVVTARWEFPHEMIDAVIDRLVCHGGADAVVTHDDFWAAALIKRLRARTVAVPRQVAVVGYLNHYLADWIDPALTTIDLRHGRAAKLMVETLEKMIADGPLPEAERAIRIQPRLVVREST
jgi:DNA-binding LacI/PurR family transcriptional regulator